MKKPTATDLGSQRLAELRTAIEKIHKIIDQLVKPTPTPK
jgi:hypothetical protein